MLSSDTILLLLSIHNLLQFRCIIRPISNNLLASFLFLFKSLGLELQDCLILCFQQNSLYFLGIVVNNLQEIDISLDYYNKQSYNVNRDQGKCFSLMLHQLLTNLLLHFPNLTQLTDSLIRQQDLNFLYPTYNFVEMPKNL